MNKYKRQDLITLGFLGLCFAIITSIYIGNKNDSESNLSSEDSEYQINTNYYDCGNPFRLTVVKPNTESDSKWEHKEITSSEGNQEATIIKDTTSKFEIGEECEIPSVPTHVKFCTDYRSYDLWYTPHYRLQQVAWTDEYGMRRYNNDYLVALGSYYSTDIGDRFEVTLDTGKTFTVMMADGKWDIDCDENNWIYECSLPSASEIGEALLWKCSVCGYISFNISTKYCPNCGAKMDEDTKC